MMILETGEGLFVITGCSHPGIETIINLVNSKFPGKAIKLLPGGFHLENKSKEKLKLISDFMKESGVKAIAPSHCTGEKAIEYFKNNWGVNMSGYAGALQNESYIIINPNFVLYKFISVS